jgi:hypothetical protein
LRYQVIIDSSYRCPLFLAHLSLTRGHPIGEYCFGDLGLAAIFGDQLFDTGSSIELTAVNSSSASLFHVKIYYFISLLK